MGKKEFSNEWQNNDGQSQQSYTFDAINIFSFAVVDDAQAK